MQINSTGSGCAFFWRFWRFFKRVSPLKRTLPSSHGVYSAGSILFWSVEIQQLSLLGSSNLLESGLDAVTPLLSSHVTIHNVTGNIENGISDNDLAGVGHCIPTEDHEGAFLIDVVHVVDTIGNDALDHLVGLLQSVDAVGFFCTA